MVLGEVLGGGSVHSAHHNMVSLVWLQGDSLHGTEFLLLEALDLGSVDYLWGLGRVDARSLDGNNKVASVLDEVRGVEAKNTGLIWLGDIGEDDVDHGHEHSVLLGVSGVLDDRDNVGSLLGHVDQITPASL